MKDSLSKAPNLSKKDSRFSQNNWYAKLHPIGTAKQADQPKRLLNLSIFFRIWLALAIVLILSGTVVFTQLFEHVKPTAQQVIEDTLLDTSKMMAANLQAHMQSGQILNADYQKQLDSAFSLPSKTKQSSRSYRPDLEEPQYKQKKFSSFRLYITDDKGVVIYDSLPAPMNEEGKDYSRWNDIYLTLKGQYGARSTPDINSTRDSSIMYVAQPIKNNLGELIGVVSIGKPVDSVLPYLDNTRQRMLITTLLISIVALILAGVVAWWLKQSISLVTRYTSALAEDTKKPYFYLGHELNSLTDTIETMKHRLENRAYVSDYVHTLTHELKSPLTAIRASSELLEDDNLDIEDRHMLSETIGEQSLKMQQLIDRLLLLAKVEQPSFRLNRQLTPLLPLLNSLIKDSHPKLQQRHLAPIKLSVDNLPLEITADPDTTLLSKHTVYADNFWLVQALQNVLDNAIYFATSSITINVYEKLNDTLDSAEPTVTIDIFNNGKLLPDYAITKVFDRYFSLSHHSSMNLRPSLQNSPTNSNTSMPKKGTGLGLTLVKQVIEHHGGSVSIRNINDDHTSFEPSKSHTAGVIVSITLPLADQSIE